MKLKNIFLLIILLIISYFTFVKPSNIIKPFYIIKDLLFSPFSVFAKDISLSCDVNESIINNLKEDIRKLEKLNNINQNISNFDIINATVISRNRDYWFNTLTINKGSSDGIDIDMAVIDSDGLIGRISSVTNNTSVVKLITTNDTKSKISAVIKNNDKDIYGIIDGYDNKNNLLHLIVDDIDIIKNSKVETTGMGGVFPRGILIGKVFDIVKKDDEVTNIVRVALSSDIKGERYVSILLRKKNTNN